MIGLNSTVSDEKFVEFAEKIATTSQQTPEVSPLTDISDPFSAQTLISELFWQENVHLPACSTNKKTKEELLDGVRLCNSH